MMDRLLGASAGLGFSTNPVTSTRVPSSAPVFKIP